MEKDKFEEKQQLIEEDLTLLVKDKEGITMLTEDTKWLHH